MKNHNKIKPPGLYYLNTHTHNLKLTYSLAGLITNTHTSTGKGSDVCCMLTLIHSLSLFKIEQEGSFF